MRAPRVSPGTSRERILDSWGVAPIVGLGADESEALLEFLERLRGAVAERRAASNRRGSSARKLAP
ncbi:MAG TPA: hypothetical protein VFV10_09300 [Gammaproteobacteria bacterium]|nr:hypothetical protein [Gammaproteobacteria bacterium]